MRYLLDTTTCSHLHGNHPDVVGRLAALPRAATLYISVVTQGEMLYGAHHAPEARRSRLLKAIRRMLISVADVLPVTRTVAERYGQVKAQLAAQGTPIPANDIWIAATAMEAGIILVTDDAHFEHVPELRLENWLA